MSSSGPEPTKCPIKGFLQNPLQLTLFDNERPLPSQQELDDALASVSSPNPLSECLLKHLVSHQDQSECYDNQQLLQNLQQKAQYLTNQWFWQRPNQATINVQHAVTQCLAHAFQGQSLLQRAKQTSGPELATNDFVSAAIAIHRAQQQWQHVAQWMDEKQPLILRQCLEQMPFVNNASTQQLEKSVKEFLNQHNITQFVAINNRLNKKLVSHSQQGLFDDFIAIQSILDEQVRQRPVLSEDSKRINLILPHIELKVHNNQLESTESSYQPIFTVKSTEIEYEQEPVAIVIHCDRLYRDIHSLNNQAETTEEQYFQVVEQLKELEYELAKTGVDESDRHSLKQVIRNCYQALPQHHQPAQLQHDIPVVKEFEANVQRFRRDRRKQPPKTNIEAINTIHDILLDRQLDQEQFSALQYSLKYCVERNNSTSSVRDNQPDYEQQDNSNKLLLALGQAIAQGDAEHGRRNYSAVKNALEAHSHDDQTNITKQFLAYLHTLGLGCDIDHHQAAQYYHASHLQKKVRSQNPALAPGILTVTLSHLSDFLENSSDRYNTHPDPTSNHEQDKRPYKVYRETSHDRTNWLRQIAKYSTRANQTLVKIGYSSSNENQLTTQSTSNGIFDNKPDWLKQLWRQSPLGPPSDDQNQQAGSHSHSMDNINTFDILQELTQLTSELTPKQADAGGQEDTNYQGETIKALLRRQLRDQDRGELLEAFVDLSDDFSVTNQESLRHQSGAIIATLTTIANWLSPWSYQKSDQQAFSDSIQAIWDQDRQHTERAKQLVRQLYTEIECSIPYQYSHYKEFTHRGHKFVAAALLVIRQQLLCSGMVDQDWQQLLRVSHKQLQQLHQWHNLLQQGVEQFLQQRHPSLLLKADGTKNCMAETLSHVIAEVDQAIREYIKAQKPKWQADELKQCCQETQTFLTDNNSLVTINNLDEITRNNYQQKADQLLNDNNLPKLNRDINHIANTIHGQLGHRGTNPLSIISTQLTEACAITLNLLVVWWKLPSSLTNNATQQILNQTNLNQHNNERYQLDYRRYLAYSQNHALAKTVRNIETHGQSLMQSSDTTWSKICNVIYAVKLVVDIATNGIMIALSRHPAIRHQGIFRLDEQANIYKTVQNIQHSISSLQRCAEVTASKNVQQDHNTDTIECKQQPFEFSKKLPIGSTLFYQKQSQIARNQEQIYYDYSTNPLLTSIPGFD